GSMNTTSPLASCAASSICTNRKSNTTKPAPGSQPPSAWSRIGSPPAPKRSFSSRKDQACDLHRCCPLSENKNAGGRDGDPRARRGKPLSGGHSGPGRRVCSSYRRSAPHLVVHQAHRAWLSRGQSHSRVGNQRSQRTAASDRRGGRLGPRGRHDRLGKWTL